MERYNIDQTGKSGVVFLEGWAEGLTAGGIKVELHEKNRQIDISQEGLGGLRGPR